MARSGAGYPAGSRPQKENAVVVKLFWPRDKSHSSIVPPQHLEIFHCCVDAVGLDCNNQ